MENVENLMKHRKCRISVDGCRKCRILVDENVENVEKGQKENRVGGK